ncbi:NAD(P)-dependent oxidoreductase [Mangrovibrevibacter kandeliae]|uniref:NAD(P)-dependent oxidoreductase n=1 Tax=Mangrovibrevibacter kandeliae TaxID=2968473 RepID=UPI002117E1DF|nr:NAD(P)-dependent oxidoreductase [Aurantimonas sp. CSK15Z-1]MCQ8781881.1 2-hydroxyacid dehydrogenase [Aurantimonas sp. CSK15Z-1]
MSTARILQLAPIPPEVRDILGADNQLVAYAKGSDAPGFDVAVTTSMAGADAALFERLPDLKLLLCNGTGVDAIDLEAAARRGIIVRNTPDEVVSDTADFAMGLLYAVGRRIAEADRFVRAGRWGPERLPPATRVSSMTIGIVGLGKIGQTIAARASGIGMSVLYTGPREKTGVPYRFVAEVGDLAGRVDALVLSCPGGPATHHLVDSAVLERLGPDGILVNVSRGSVVNEAALIEALAAGAIKGAGLDVFAAEPGLDPRFLGLENVVLAPHYASVTAETRAAIGEALAGAARDFRAGRDVFNAAR